MTERSEQFGRIRPASQATGSGSWSRPSWDRVASGVNNAVASVASLLAVALFGAIALNDFNRALDHRLTTQTVSSEVKRAVEGARGKFVIEPALAAVQGDDCQVTESIVRDALAESIRLAMLLAAALALAGAVALP